MVVVAGKEEVVHIPNSGRLRELLYAGNEVGLHFEGHPNRKTRYSLVAARTPEGWCYLDSRLPNRILTRHWQVLPPLAAYDGAVPEVGYGASRFDLGLREQGTAALDYLEAKCVTLVRDGTGIFPDAPTERGRKHLLELIEVVQSNRRAYLFFFLQHPAGWQIKANRETDPEFSRLMARAHERGVRFYAFRVVFETDRVKLMAIPVLWEE